MTSTNGTNGRGPAAGRVAIGIDMGGSGIKAAAVDVETGELRSQRLRVKTPQPATPGRCIEAMRELVDQIATAVPLDPAAPVGVGVPAVAIDGIVLTATNIDDEWLGFDAGEAVTRTLGRRAAIVNDADAAGLAELRFGAGRGRQGTVLVVTLGTGVGSALFRHGDLVPNTELGHIEIRGRDAE
jgi:polyphosphate glucokinase